VPVHCGAVPADLLESELFGHLKGSFTGAHADRAGLVEAAHGGTLFLDEIGEMPPTMQVKLLRFLADGTYQPVGAREMRHADVRIVAATHRDLPPPWPMARSVKISITG
jgi:two-component system NtrC family response regulator